MKGHFDSLVTMKIKIRLNVSCVIAKAMCVKDKQKPRMNTTVMSEECSSLALINEVH
jgi:hypothetical protein